MPTAYEALCSHLRQTALLDSVAQLASWDQETYMPPGGAGARAESLAALAALVHQRRVDPQLAQWLAEAEREVGDDEARRANLREIRRDYELNTRVPAELVAEIARTTSRAQEVWKRARQENDFPAFRPWLEKVMGLMQRKAECLGVPAGGEPYDALLDIYEPGATARQIEQVFTPLRARLTALIANVRASRRRIPVRCLDVRVPEAAQHDFGLEILSACGFDLARGRLDRTTHPFCSGLAPGDTRLTTRYREKHFTDALYSTMHEMGHGLYEQGLPKESRNGEVGACYGTPLAESVSLGIHESQSRLWENFVGRSREFWMWALPRARRHFGGAFLRYTPEDYYRAVNTVTPSLIRVEADETTYNIHVMIRFEIERLLIRGEMPVKDIPREWNRRYAEYLGVKVPDDRRGCLQDVHWSFGLLGYFPTYTLGNLYAAQFWEAARHDIRDLPKQISRGKFESLREWLRTKIHRHGRRYRAGELCRRVTGADLSPEPLLRHLDARAREIYSL
jgi:carboxypeptidase Taq